MILVQLLHGRNHPDDVLEDWGFNGPILGPYEWFHNTYGSDIKLGEEQFIKVASITDDIQLPPFNSDDLIELFGSYYGDMSVFSDGISNEEIKQKIKRTQEILSTPLEQISLLIHDPEQWIQNFARHVLFIHQTRS